MAVTVMPLATVLVISSFIAPYRVTYFWVGRPWLQLAIAATRYVGGVKTQMKGYDNLLAAAEGNRVIICSKHQSTFETFFFPSVMTNPVAYVYKKELRWVPFFGWAVRCCGFPVKIGVLIGEIASSTALTPWGTARISPPRSRYDLVCDSSRRRISCFDGGFFTVFAPEV